MKNENLDYSTIVGLVNERNRPSGGIKTIQEVCVNCFINKNSKILEIGSNTGFTSVNMNLLTGADVLGIDINELSIKNATDYAERMGSTAKFMRGSALDIPLNDCSFDIVWASNVTSFLNDKNKAISEYVRVLKDGGFLIFVPIYYKKEPPREVLDGVSEAVGVRIDVKSREDWINLLKKNFESSEFVYQSNYEYVNQEGLVESYIQSVINESGLEENISDSDLLDKIRNRYRYFIELFNENLKYCGYSIFILQKRKFKDQEELFLTNKII